MKPVFYSLLIAAVLALMLGCTSDQRFVSKTIDESQDLSTAVEITPDTGDRGTTVPDSDTSTDPQGQDPTPEDPPKDGQPIDTPYVPPPPTPDPTIDTSKTDPNRGIVADCALTPTDDLCLFYDGALVVDCSVNPRHPLCMTHEANLSNECQASADDPDADITNQMCQGRSGQVMFEACASCIEEHGGDSLQCAPCMNRKFGVLVTEKDQQISRGEGGKVDILWVLDNSPSMVDEQTAIAQNFGKFIERLNELAIDFHVAITLTDPSAATKGKFVSEVFTFQTPDLVNRFKAAVEYIHGPLLCAGDQVGIDCYNEQGLETARTALQMAVNGQAPNAGFYRSDAKLAVIFVSDSDDMFEVDPHRTFEAMGERTAQINFFTSLKPSLDQITLSAFVADGSEGCEKTCWAASEDKPGIFQCTLNTGLHDNIESVGERYIAAARLTGGLVASICDPDFDQILESLGANAAGLKVRFKIGAGSDPYSIVVWVDGTIVPRSRSNGWTFDTATDEVVFHGSWIPRPAAEVKTTYYKAQ